MITESLTIQVLHIISLALTPIEQWEAAKRYFYTASSAEARLTVFAVVALIILVILLFRLSAKRRNSEHRLTRRNVDINSSSRRKAVQSRRKRQRLRLFHGKLNFHVPWTVDYISPILDKQPFAVK